LSHSAICCMAATNGRGMTEFSTTATESLYLNLCTVEREDPQITKRNWLPNLDFFASRVTVR
jgi:hypothetical protein